MKKILFPFMLLLAISVYALPDTTASLVAGVAKVNITPPVPAWLTGYASRKTQATGVLHPIWAKALVLEQNADARIIFVTVDVLGLSHEIVEDVFEALHAKYGIRRSQLLLNSSHTHSGPMIWPCLDGIYDFSPDDQKKVAQYTQLLTRNIIDAVDQAMSQRFPAKLFSGHGEAGFAINRRESIHVGGPTDHDVPVLKVMDDNNRVRAVLFGYACHNTTLVDDNLLINGDYAGFAQIAVEQNNPGAIGLFLMGCAGDQNPSPRGTVADAQQHGTELAAAVQGVLSAGMKPVRAPIRTDYEHVFLAFHPFDKAVYQKDITGDNIYLQRRAKLMLEAYNKGWGADKLAYPVQAVRFNNDLCILGLSDEVVVDYDTLFKKIFRNENLYVAGYCNDVQCYIPSRRLLAEGGYEPDESMIYYGQPSSFADDVEERITRTVLETMKSVGAKASESSDPVSQARQAQIRQTLQGTLATYAFPPKTLSGEIDDARLIRELREEHANTYHWLAWGKSSDLRHFEKFLPLAQKAGIKVWLSLVPPSEAPPFAAAYSEPYRLDYQQWAKALAVLSLRYPNFVAWSIDDFVHNLQLFTPAYTKQMLEQARRINPRFAFVPCAYYEQITPAFAVNYGGLLDGVLFPYRNESVVVNLKDASTVGSEIAFIRSLFAPGFLVFLDVYATGHSSYGETTPEYVRQVIGAGMSSADGVLIYCHQDPKKYPEKFDIIKAGFAKQNSR